MSRFDDNPNAQEPGITSQDWSAGLMHTRPGDRLPPGYYRRLVNGEIRRGFPETRRGLRPMKWMLNNGAPLADVVQAVKWWRPSRATIQVPPAMCLLIGDNELWHCAPGNVPRRLHAAITDATQPCEILPSFDVALILRGLEQAPVLFDPYNALLRGGGVLELEEPASGSGRIVLPPASVGCVTAGRVWLRSGVDQVVASDIFEFYYNPLNVFRVEAGGGQEIVRMVPYGGNAIAVFKTDGVYRMVNTDQALEDTSSTFYVEKIYAAQGCVAGDSVQQIGSNFLYLSPNGVEQIQVSGTELIAQPAGSFSAAVNPYFKGLSWPAASAARGVVADNYYLLAVPSKATWKVVDPLAVRWGSEFPEVVGFEPGSEGVLAIYLSDGVTLATSPLDFGDVDPGDTADLTLVLKNEGGADIDVSGTQISGTGYSILTAPADSVLSPGETTTVVVRYTNPNP
jgi:hypothetical protein